MRYLIAGVLALSGVATVALASRADGPNNAQQALSISAAVCLLALAGLWMWRWPSRPQSVAMTVIGTAAGAVASVTQEHALIGLGGCFLLAAMNSVSALMQSVRTVATVIVIATASAGVLGIELAVRSNDLALAVSVVALVLALNIALPVAAKIVARTVQEELSEVDRDALTGLYNRRAFLREVAELTRRPRQPDDHLVITVVDIDNFKNVNDTAGHAAGDRALIAVAKTLRDECAMSAVIARYGGEEFVVADILSEEEGGARAQQLCRRLASIPSDVPFTASVGWSSMSLRNVQLDAESQALDAVLARADTAMYAAKRSGGNRVGHHPAPRLGDADEFAFDVWLHRAALSLEQGDDAADDVLDAAVDGVGLQSVFQPIVLLADEAVIGFEALTRWPQLDNPDPVDVLAQAETMGRTGELERKCIESAFRGAFKVGVGSESWLFINTESAATDAALGEGLRDARLVFELTERRLLSQPGALLRKVDALRAQGYAIALDDVGAQRDSLALLDVVCPDIIKLQPELLRRNADNEHVRAIAAVLAHRARTGAALLVEGIETRAHLERAREIGATLGQGYLFGRPAAAAAWPGRTVPWSPEPVEYPPALDDRSPFDIVADAVPVLTQHRSTLVALSRYIENLASHAASPPIVLAAVQTAENFTGSTRLRYRRLAAASPLVAVFGRDLETDLGSGVRGVPLGADDQLADEWIVLVLGPDVATALVARDLDDRRRGRLNGERRFATTYTHDRLLVTMAARSLLSRVR